MSISRTNSSYLADPPNGPVEEPQKKAAEFEIVGSSTAMERLRLQVRRIGPHFRTVLVSGEAGTGKELVARALHEKSQGAGGPFVACHAAALEDALASWARREGVSSTPADTFDCLVKMSQRGTLFLDSIHEMPHEAQLQLLRILRRLELAQSSLEPRRPDVRLIATTSENLRTMASSGRFLQELYQRLSMVEITPPPLRSHVEDLPELVKCLLNRSASFYGRTAPSVSDEAMERMLGYRWRGNVRELESVLQSSLLQVDGGVLELHHLSLLADGSLSQPNSAAMGESTRLQDVVEHHVLRVLKECRGNKLRAAEALGISRSTLYRMLDAVTPTTLQ
jgi:DNA-binding NtrC family response regulator